ncbi:hypothetical protein K437DRAFT_253946 [Tilletiaria anomala UBC 951]|uniref:MICOS complex subunit MIC12 n=1 Tax=Tilletiaria anomala (strain ATCC 24038 / CBS 436.72 / UBC 951) TaxID=1037660 RepID=A0A066WQ42_TILAU|nr:uncharacterized protein K437DRAFT_253946 [Tilletiaria anomala UBC 951]KDN52745.1 hypothetical protein K437DRAFT_253946 [Tilletiaria anomala UBC 951]
MAAYVLAPIAGAFVATSLIYSMRHKVRTDTQAFVTALQQSRAVLDNLDEELSAGSEASGNRQKVFPPSYVRPTRPTLAEEMKARWNEHLTGFIKQTSEIEWDSVFRNAYNKVKGVVEEVAPSSESAFSQISGGATLRDPVPKAPGDPRLLQPNTYYLGQGTSLR